jgi:HK97 family phage prohead protease
MPLYEDTGPPLQVCGYASVFNTIYATEDGLERVEPGAFNLAGKPLFATFDHDHARPFARTGDRTLEAWQDGHGLAFRAALPSSWRGLGLANGIRAGDFRNASVFLLERRVARVTEHGRPVNVIVSADIGEISLTPSGANPDAVCWLEHEDPEALPADIRHARALWQVGRQAAQLAAARARRPQGRAPSPKVPPPARRNGLRPVALVRFPPWLEAELDARLKGRPSRLFG